ncbi:HAD domain-containing protein [Undibacterium sp. Xuan67W]|uniref:HAD domain-containing protein n=1 Tax=Undibacterium sp. Xuan67W TaxID=3413057 RepID=UPI003BF0D792
MILFLDFDGVLHPFSARHDQEQQFVHLPALEELLREFPTLQIVVSSEWRLRFSLNELRGFFSTDIAARIIGVTPEIQIRETTDILGSRFREIEAFLIDAYSVNETWLALDDDVSLFPPDCSQLILCGELPAINRFAMLKERLMKL